MGVFVGVTCHGHTFRDGMATVPYNDKPNVLWRPAIVFLVMGGFGTRPYVEVAFRRAS